MQKGWNDEERQAWAALSAALERAVPELLARFDAQVEAAAEKLALEVQDFLRGEAKDCE